MENAEARSAREAVKLRVRRFYVLRSARRALSRSTVAAQHLPEREEFVRLGEHLVALGRGAAEALNDGPLEKLDAWLDTLAGQLRAVCDRLDFAQVRASLVLDRRDADEERGLLDVLCADEGGGSGVTASDESGPAPGDGDERRKREGRSE